MQIIEITALDNGAHNNHTLHGVVPEGWAVVPVDPDSLENFPFGTFEVEEINGQPYMKADTWEPLPMPEPELVPTPEPDVWDELDKAYQEGYQEGYTEGVNTAYDQ